MKKRKGYTLIEILIVLLIISIVSAVAAVSIRYNENKAIETLARQLSQLLNLASEEAMLRPATLGLGFSKKQFQFFIAEINPRKKNSWNVMTDRPFKAHPIPADITIMLKINKVEIEPNGKPQITVTPNGDFSNFVILLRDKKGKPRYQVIKKPDGVIKSEPYHEEE